MIKNIIFDLGGVIMTLDPQQAVERFRELGVADAAERLDSYTQAGIFGDMEEGKISAEEFRRELGKLAGRELSFDDCKYAWTGYVKEVPKRNLRLLLKLREQGYRLILLSNTNPYMMSWAMSGEFDGEGHPLSDYFDSCYLSYEVKAMKPSETFFRHVIAHEAILPEESLFLDDGPRNVEMAAKLGIKTFCPANGEDWTEEIYSYL